MDHSRRSCLVDALKNNNRFADGALFFEAGLFGPDYWDEIETMGILNKAKNMFDGRRFESATRNGGAFHSYLGLTLQPHRFSARNPLTPVAAND